MGYNNIVLNVPMFKTFKPFKPEGVEDAEMARDTSTRRRCVCVDNDLLGGNDSVRGLGALNS